jgi:hypothetical protein
MPGRCACGSSSNALAVQRFAVAALAGANATATRIQALLTSPEANVPAALRPYVAAVRAQLGNVQPNGAEARTRITR